MVHNDLLIAGGAPGATILIANGGGGNLLIAPSTPEPVPSEGGGSGGKVKSKGVSLVEQQLQDELEAKRKIQAFGAKHLIHPNAKLFFEAKFQMPVEGYLRHESRFKLKVMLKFQIDLFAKHFKQMVASPEFISRFKLKQKSIPFQSTFSHRTFGRLDFNSVFKLKQSLNLENISRFDYSKIIAILDLFQEILNLEKTTKEFDFEESVAVFYQDDDDDREKSFDEPSTVVGRVTYTPDLQTMEVELTGRVYNYCGVPERIFDAFKGAGSKGAFYNREIKNIFTC